MTVFELRNILLDIMKSTYGDNMKNFYLNFIAEEKKSKHGDYTLSTKIISIYNLSRDSQYTVTTSIHELAHHCEYMLSGTTGHQKSFYEVYKVLLTCAIKKGYISYDIIRQASDVRDIRMLEKHCGYIDAKYDEEMDINKNLFRISVKNAFNIKEMLSQNGYNWDGLDQAWYKIIEKNIVTQEEQFIKQLDINVNYTINEKNKATIEAIYTIIVSGKTFACKDKLYAIGFTFGNIKTYSKVWYKKIPAKSYDDYLLKLNTIKEQNAIKWKLAN